MTAILRPNGKPYRPRLGPAVHYLPVGDSDAVVLVRRTHDVTAWQSRAERLWEVETGDAVPLVGVACWVRLVPWDTSGHGGDSTWVSCDGDDPRGCPAVEYRPRGGGG